MSRIHFLRDGHSFVAEEDRMVQLPTDLPTIENVIAELAIGMVIVDVFSAFIADGYNMNQDSDMRRCLSPIAALAERTQTVWLLLRHLNKREGTRSMYRGGGSIAIIGACRAGFAVAPHPEDADMKVFVPIKHNLGPRPPCLTYAIEQEGTSSRVIWGGPTELTAAEVMRAPTGRGGSKLEYAKEIIQDVLSGGPRGSNEVARACTDTGISDPTYWRARRSLGIVAEKTGFQGEWLLSLPSQNGQQHEEF